LAPKFAFYEKSSAMRNGSTATKRLQKIDGLSALLMGCLVLLIIAIVLLASVPPVSRDALTHHLAILKLYITQGGFYEIPYAKWSYYPMNVDLLYLMPLYFGNDIIPKYIHFLFALFSAGLIFRYLRQRIDLPHAMLGVIFFLSVPVIVKLSMTVYVDLGLIFFSLAALFYFLKWVETDYRWTYLVASAICCGIALGTKYNGLIGFFLLTLFVVFVYSRLSPATPFKQTRALLYGAAFMLIVGIVFSPWAIRNYIWTNNPVYPLYNKWFNPRQAATHATALPNSTHASINESDVKIEPSKASWTHFAVRKIIFNEKWWQISLIPIRIFFQGQDDQPKYFDGKLNPLLFFLPFFAFIRIKKDIFCFYTNKKRFW
jgi:4-amino-4-deoxy-L-arabinose transferase-like glycosyltransferase